MAIKYTVEQGAALVLFLIIINSGTKVRRTMENSDHLHVSSLHHWQSANLHNDHRPFFVHSSFPRCPGRHQYQSKLVNCSADVSPDDFSSNRNATAGAVEHENELRDVLQASARKHPAWLLLLGSAAANPTTPPENCVRRDVFG
ncbi:hypothetical protein T07_14389 [Trichinella nelsoni]|uniref:Uncharacterized protein n=1 Tax=Trichinella nelsoni TaxID=6336 RepID=A0A0V0SLR0_9BILA|nr:hypothetical protein T07_14389 [Trichinella nelsoni]